MHARINNQILSQLDYVTIYGNEELYRTFFQHRDKENYVTIG